jgi:hypothetical protein
MVPSPMFIRQWLAILVVDAEKTRRQDGREVAWQGNGGVMVAGPQESRLRRSGGMCRPNFGVGPFSLAFSAGFWGGELLSLRSGCL